MSGSKEETSDLRLRAESALKGESSDALEVAALSAEEVGEMVHELRVHQIELEMQNEELRAAQIALEESRDKYLDLYDFAPVGYFTLDGKGIILEANLTAVRLLDIERESLLKRPFSRLVGKEDADTLYLHFNRVFERGAKQTCEVRLVKRDGAFFHAQLESIALPDENGRFNRCRTIVSDITDRRHAEEALRGSESRLANYLAGINEMGLGVLVVDRDYTIRHMNPAIMRWFGDHTGKVCYESLAGLSTPCSYCRLHEVINESHIVHYEAANPDGRTFSIIAAPVTENDGSISNMELVAEITDRKRMEELGLQSARIKAVADLASGVAHHFNNLLQIVVGITSLSLLELESGDLSGLKTDLEQMLETVKMGAETVRRLQAFSNTRADIVDRNDVVFDITTTVRNSAEMLKALWKSGPKMDGIRIDLRLDLKDGCLVRGRENEMTEALVNLIKNAAEALPEGGFIQVETYTEGDEVVVSVRDNGIGIAEQDLARVFQPFWSTKGVGIGTGMGLAVTHGLVKRHGGDIAVQSIAGAGTAFTIRLRLAQEPLRSPERPGICPVESHLNILVIDDVPAIAALLKRICAAAGHDAFMALSGEEGLAVFGKEAPDLVICDLGMPGMSGWEVGKAIRSSCREKGITKPLFILLTGWGDQGLEKEKIIESGVDVVVSKPIDSESLCATIREVAARLGVKSQEK